MVRIKLMLVVVLSAVVVVLSPSAPVWAAEGSGSDPMMLFPIVKDGKWGYMDKDGKVVIEPQYQLALDFHEGLACVAENALRGFIDKTGKMVINTEYDAAWEFSKGLARVGVGEKEGYIDHAGTYVWEPTE